MAASGSQVGSGDRPVPVEEIFRLLESTNLTIVDDIHQLILENLSQGKELWLINTLVDYFFSTRSLKAQALLAEVREPLDKVLIDKIHDGLRSADTRLQATQLLLFLVNQQPPWTHSIVTRSVFTTLLKIMKSETDVPILMTSILVLVILLPVVPVSIEPHLAEVMEAFARVVGLLVKKPANCPDIFILHLHVAVYAFFLRLYGMFPCTLVSFLRINYAKKENLHAYNEVIVPMLERLRFHPNLITGSKDTETSKTRWQRLEPQDVVVSCAKMCLDVIEGASEELRCPLISSVVPRLPKYQELSGRRDVQEKSWQEKLDAVNHMFPVVEDPTAMVFSPSQLIGLSTPPTSERATPAVVFDQGVPVPGQTAVVLGPHHIAVPTPELPSADPSALTEEPDKSLAGHNTKSASVYRSGLKGTPGCSAFVSPFTVRAPPPSQAPSVEPSPMRPQAETVESSMFQFCEYAASRVLQFDRSPESKGAERLKYTELGDLTVSQEAGRLRELREDAELAPAGAGAVAEDTILAVVQTSQESDPLDQEVSHFTEVDKQFDGSTSVDSSTDDTSQVDPQQHLTAQSIIQFMKKVNRIRFNSMSTQAGEPLMGPHEKHPRPGRARSCPTLPHQELTVPEQDSCRSSSSSDAGSVEASTTVETLLEISVPGNDREVQFGDTASLELPLQTPSHASSRQSRNGNDGSLPSLNSSNRHQARSSMGVPPAIKEFAAFFQTLLAPVKVAVCEQCYQVFLEAGMSGETGQHQFDGKRQSLGTWLRCFCSETSVFSSLSPPELLDRHLSRSSDLHAKELARIPLTSWDNVSWTHFGGVPPADEINILRGQILLLHNQLMYERHKRNNHAMRNRRLLRRIAHATTLEEQVQSLTSQLQNSEKHIHNLQVSLKLLQDKNHQLEQKQESDEYEKLFAFRTTLQQNKDLTEGNVELKNLLLVQKAENDELKKELQQVRAGMFQLEKSNEILQKKLQEAHKWREQVLQLQKEVLLMGEAQEHLQERLQQHRAHQSSTSHQTYLVQALQAEIEDLRKQLRQAIPMVEALQVKVTAMEDIIKSKDIAIAEMKNTFQNTKIMYTNEIQAVNDKYQAMLHINTQLEAQLLQQYADNDRLKYRLKDPNPKGVQRRDVKSPNTGKETAELWDRTKMQGQLSKQPSTEDAKSHKDQKGSPSAQETSSFSLMLSLENSGSGPHRQTAERPALCDSSPHTLTVQENESCGIEQLATVHSSHQTPCASLEASVSSSMGMTGKTEAEELKEKLSVQADANLSSGGLSAFSSSGMFLAEPEDRSSFSTHSDITSDSGIFSKGDPIT